MSDPSPTGRLPPTWSGSTVSTSGSCIASALMQRMSKPYTLSQKSIFSCLRHDKRCQYHHWQPQLCLT